MGKIGHDRFFLDEQWGEGAPRGATGSPESLGSLGGVWMTDLRRNNKAESVLRTRRCPVEVAREVAPVIVTLVIVIVGREKLSMLDSTSPVTDFQGAHVQH